MIPQAISIISAIAGGVMAFMDKDDRGLLFWVGVVFFVAGVLGIIFTS
jgi:hypothetical protein